MFSYSKKYPLRNSIKNLKSSHQNILDHLIFINTLRKNGKTKRHQIK